jgi:hypothetical protein
MSRERSEPKIWRPGVRVSAAIAHEPCDWGSVANALANRVQPGITRGKQRVTKAEEERFVISTRP